jgi:glycosyltransferase involved in cell wall biosynthesis
MDLSKVKVSVVMCTYNGEASLRQQLDSIVKQTFPLSEFLIFDDASSDQTIAILAEYAASYPIISIYRNEKNIGYAANFKQALKSAKGDVIAIADQDDIWVLNKIEKMLAQWEPNSLLIYCNSVRFKDTLPTHPASAKNYRRFDGIDARKLFLFNTVSGHAIMLKRELLTLAIPFSNNIFYDWWLAVVAAYNGGVSYLEEILVFQRVHPGNVSIGGAQDHSNKAQRNAYKRMVITHLNEFKKVRNITERDKVFIDEFLDLLNQSLVVKFHLPMLVFLIKNRNVLFFHKKKKTAFFSYMKYAWQFTYNYG